MTITYTQVNVRFKGFELWKREVEEGKMLLELTWSVVREGVIPDDYGWSYRTHNYNEALEWIKKPEEVEE